MENKKTLVLGASPNQRRYSNMAVHRLAEAGHQVVPVGTRDGKIAGVEIVKGQPATEGVDTITLYLNPQNQRKHYDYIFSLNPKRIIFNPGAENLELYRMAQDKGIEVENACTLVMLSLQQY